MRYLGRSKTLLDPPNTLVSIFHSLLCANLWPPSLPLLCDSRGTTMHQTNIALHASHTCSSAVRCSFHAPLVVYLAMRFVPCRKLLPVWLCGAGMHGSFIFGI